MLCSVFGHSSLIGRLNDAIEANLVDDMTSKNISAQEYVARLLEKVAREDIEVSNSFVDVCSSQDNITTCKQFLKENVSTRTMKHFLFLI